ncbi:MAG: 2-oxoglutarate dehydrogenase complex dihydrolipoyllysine-residue succinyltransferase [Bacteroidales bacterium]|jgi:2-oxoglutarate dehydrogenase E2 component (dihydrolipoamide succinyltransferase)|nr:2-oxoglutarate dehydrogenase complex dihydrolipoyllysine-residue succinyltransferase [Bacteroidales bacterium]
MAIEITIPSPGESITQVQVAKWLVANGETVDKDQEIVEIDSDKASFPLASPESGIVKILVPEGETIAVGAIIAMIETKDSQTYKLTTSPSEPSPPVTSPSHHFTISPSEPSPSETSSSELHASPLARKIIEESKVNIRDISNAFPGKKLTRKDIESFVSRKKDVSSGMTFDGSRGEERKRMTTLRLKLAERLVAVKNQTAMLTTFNEINMQAVLGIRDKYSEVFKERFGVGLGLMSFFTKAVTIALKEFPQVNSMIDGDDLITPKYVDIGIAVSAPKGLVVPVLRNAEQMSFPEIEQKIRELAAKARENKISIDDMKGGTFTITNGGVFGSLMSTPILNPPQSAILGMHRIQERPIALNGQVVLASMMYVALSYDHRVIDGRESVSFLVRVKELVEDPAKMLTEGLDPIKLLLDL